MTSPLLKVVNTVKNFPDLINQLNILFEKNLFKDSLELIECVLTDYLDRLLSLGPVRFLLHPCGMVVVSIANILATQLLNCLG